MKQTEKSITICRQDPFFSGYIGGRMSNGVLWRSNSVQCPVEKCQEYTRLVETANETTNKFKQEIKPKTVTQGNSVYRGIRKLFTQQNTHNYSWLNHYNSLTTKSI